MTELKVGDLVKVRNNLKDIRGFAGGYTSSMDGLMGKVVTIKEVIDECRVRIEEDTHEFCWDTRAFDPVEMVNDKYDIKDGDIVTLRNGDKLRWDGDSDHFIDIADNYNHLCDMYDINDDMTMKDRDDSDSDIIKVERAFEYKTVYKREETVVKEMTIKEISEALGYEVKIVKEANND